MEESLRLRVIAISVIAVVSTAGFLAPLGVKSFYSISNIETSPLFLLMKSFSAGIILGVALMHLLVDAVEDLMDYVDYPLPLALLMGGILFTVALDHVTLQLVQSLSSTKKILDTGRSIDLRNTNKELPLEIQQDLENPLHSNLHMHVHANHLIADSNSQKAMTKACVLESSIAVHSIIVGYSFGNLGPEHISTLKVLVIALAFHQFFEGVALGSAIAESKLGRNAVIFFATTFTLSFCLSATVGIFHTPTEEAHIIQGCFNAIAAGLLVYSSLVEMIAEDFTSSVLFTYPNLKTWMFLNLLVGATVMAVLALYA